MENAQCHAQSLIQGLAGYAFQKVHLEESKCLSLWSGEGLSLVRIVAELPDFLSLCTVVIIVEPFLFVVSHSIIGEFIFQYYQKEEHSNSSALPASS